MNKIDLKKDMKHLYLPSAREVVQVEVPPLKYLMVDGAGDPNTSQQYAQAVEALFAVSYTAKFMVKKGPQALDYAVMLRSQGKAPRDLPERYPPRGPEEVENHHSASHAMAARRASVQVRAQSRAGSRMGWGKGIQGNRTRSIPIYSKMTAIH